MRVAVQNWGSAFDELAEHVREILDDIHSRSFFSSHAPRSWRPRLNFYETDGAFFVCVELAGMTREEIEVRVDQGVLHIQGARRKPMLPDGSASSMEGVSVHLMEIDSGRFHRRVNLPADVPVEGISAVYRQGYLWVIMPRRRDAADASRP